MPKFILAYHGGNRPASKEEGATHMKNWNNWISNLGDAVVAPSMYLGKSNTVSTDGVVEDGGANPLGGITIVQADTMDAALEIAKACPHCGIGGTIEVAPVMEM